MAVAVKPGGSVACSAFSAPFLLSHGEELDFDVATGVHHESTEVNDSVGVALAAELWTTCFTPRELRLLFAANSISVNDVWSVNPGDYAKRKPDLEHAEFFVVGRRSNDCGYMSA